MALLRCRCKIRMIFQTSHLRGHTEKNIFVDELLKDLSISLIYLLFLLSTSFFFLNHPYLLSCLLILLALSQTPLSRTELSTLSLPDQTAAAGGPPWPRSARIWLRPSPALTSSRRARPASILRFSFQIFYFCVWTTEAPVRKKWDFRGVWVTRMEK